MSQTPLNDQLARISKEEFDRYMRDFRPTEYATQQSLNEQTVGAAMDGAQQESLRARDALTRMRERYGTDVSSAQAGAEARQSGLGTTLSTLGAANTAYLGDRDRRQQGMAGLMNVGQQLRQQAMGNYGSAAGLESSRVQADMANQNAYKQQKAADKAQTYQSLASIGATAAMMFMM